MRKLVIGLILAGLLVMATVVPAFAVHHFSACTTGDGASSGAVDTAFDLAPGVGTPNHGTCTPTGGGGAG